MTRMIRWLFRCAAVCVAVGTQTGCQTYFGGMTLPSPHYLKHYPTYFPPDPAFPLQREQDSMLDPTGEIRRGENAVGGGAFGVPPLPGGVPIPVPGGVNPVIPVPIR